jgi:hypothetical protein
MQLTLPYKNAFFRLNAEANGDLTISTPDDTLAPILFKELLLHMSYDDIISTIGENEFLNIVAYYHEEYEP